MNKKNAVFLLSAVAALLLAGCSGKEPVPFSAPAQAKQQAEDPRHKVSVSAVDMPVRKLMKSVCIGNGFSCDFSKEPSARYRVTFSYNGGIDGLIGAIRDQTGVVYDIRNGMIGLSNKDEVTLYEDPLKKSQCDEKAITISFKDTPVQDAFKYFYDQYGYSFLFDLRYTTLSPVRTANISQMPNQGMNLQMPILNDKGQSGAQSQKKDVKTVSFYYNGCDSREALSSFLKSLDFVSLENKDQEFTIRDYELAMIKKSIYFDYSLTQGSQSGSTTSSTGSTSSSTTGGTSINDGSSKSTVSITEKYKDNLVAMLQNHKSPDGRLDFSDRGFVVVEDHPSYVQAIKKIVKQENDQEKPLAVSINIVRVDLKDDYKAGVDWNAVWNKGLFGLRDLKISSSMAGLVNGGFSVSGAFKGTDQILSMLQEYGKTKIERSRTIEIRSGYLASFEAVKPIPYISQTSTITGGTTGFSQGSITPLSEEEGVVLNILPNINIEENFVDMGIDVTVAEYTGDKQFDLGTQGIYTLPIVPKDKAKFAARARIGDTVILTGFKVHKSGNNRKGIPGFSQVPVAGSLFGYQDDTDETSEILIIMKVEKGV